MEEVLSSTEPCTVSLDPYTKAQNRETEHVLFHNLEGFLRGDDSCHIPDLESRRSLITLYYNAIERVGLTYSPHWLRGDFRPYEMKPLEKLEHSLLFLCLPSDKFAISDKETLKVICKDFELSTSVKELVSNMNWEEKYPTLYSGDCDLKSKWFNKTDMNCIIFVSRVHYALANVQVSMEADLQEVVTTYLDRIEKKADGKRTSGTKRKGPCAERRPPEETFPLNRLVVFKRNLEALKEFCKAHPGQLPTGKQYQKLNRWLRDQNSKFSENPDDPFLRFIAPALKEAGCDITQTKGLKQNGVTSGSEPRCDDGEEPTYKDDHGNDYDDNTEMNNKTSRKKNGRQSNTHYASSTIAKLPATVQLNQVSTEQQLQDSASLPNVLQAPEPFSALPSRVAANGSSSSSSSSRVNTVKCARDIHPARAATDNLLVGDRISRFTGKLKQCHDMIAEGRSLKNQGRDEINKGRAMVAEGDNMMNQGYELLESLTKEYPQLRNEEKEETKRLLS